MTEHEGYITPKEFAGMQPITVTVQTVINWCNWGWLPAVRYGGRWFIPPDAVVQKKQKTQNPVALPCV